MGYLLPALLVLAVPLLLLYRRRLLQQRANPLRLPHPPGPRQLPIIGNLFDLPTKDEYATYHNWAQKYGEWQL